MPRYGSAGRSGQPEGGLLLRQGRASESGGFLQGDDRPVSGFVRQIQVALEVFGEGRTVSSVTGRLKFLERATLFSVIAKNSEVLSVPQDDARDHDVHPRATRMA